jgi:hypothetical protein
MNILRIVETEVPAATLLIRLAVGGAFASEGIQKFLHADAQGVIDIIVAIASTTVPILLGHGCWLFAHTFAPKAGLCVGGGAWAVDATLERLLLRGRPARRAVAGSLTAMLVLALAGCSRETSTSAGPAVSKPAVAVAPANAWLLAGTEDERFARVARHLRGLDVAMIEIGYRYGELYWAGMGQNWEYAKYQLEKIDTARRLAIERRPKRAASAQMLDGALSGVRQAVVAKDSPLFAQRFDALTEMCNACHQAEQVPFFHIVRPSIRSSPVGAMLKGSP